jgi:RNA 3'-phosphate cyclase
LCDAETSPLKVGSAEVTFEPGKLRAAELDLDTGTAGSIGLVLQSLLLAGIGLSGPWSSVLRGGTDVPNAPSCDYLKNVKLALLARMGYRVGLRIIKRGYYPKGGGIVQVQLDPPQDGLLEGPNLPMATETIGTHGLSHASSGLSRRRVAERQRRHATKALTDLLHIPAKIDVEYGPTRSAGSGLLVWAKTKDSVTGASALGAPQKPAEEVADEAVEMLLRTYHTHAAVDPWLGDQILPYMALSQGPSVISVPYLTRHMKTNMWVIQRFLNVRFFGEEQDQRVRIECVPGEGVRC